MYTLARFEETGLSIWLRESGAAFFTSLTIHSLAMGFVVGINIAINLRLVGFLPRFAVAPLARFYPLHWYAAVAIFLSGLSLLMAYPAKALTNPLFYIKLTTVITALCISRYFQKMISGANESFEVDLRTARLAYFSLSLWLVAVTAGRFLAYTHSVLLASRFY